MSEQPEQQPAQDRRPAVVPTTVRAAGGLVTLEGSVAVVAIVTLIVRALLGHDQSAASGYGLALWIAILGGAVLAAGLALLFGRRWGRAIAVVAQVLLLPVVWSLLASDQLLLGILLGVVAVASLGLLVSPPTSAWMADQYDLD